MSTSLDEKTWRELSEIAFQRRVSELFMEETITGFRPILIKGWSVSRFYDAGHFRTSTDVDLLFPEGKAAEISRAIEALKSRTPIDAHFGPRHLDKLSFADLLSRSYEVELNGVPIRVLSDEDNLRLTAVHWLLDGCVYREKLWDIYFLVKNRRPDFDWISCLQASGPIRKNWVIAAIVTAGEHLGLDLAATPSEIRNFSLPDWYKRTLEREWSRGIYTRRMLSTVITEPRLLAEQFYRRFPPNPIAATIDAEALIDRSTRLPVQVISLASKIVPFARGLRRRLPNRFQRDAR